jgi:hypothetical protein
MLIEIRIRANCPRHRGYNPQRDGEDGIRGGCTTCRRIPELYQLGSALTENSRKLKHELDLERGLALFGRPVAA